MKHKILVTGGQGLVGHAVARELLVRDYTVRISSRQHYDSSNDRLEYLRTGNLDASTVWRDALTEVDAVVHCAARVHVMHDVAASPLNEFRSVNTHGTLNLARQCAQSGVRRFIFISSVKVNGEVTALGHPFDEKTVVPPDDPYGLSKYEAEMGLRAIAEATGMEVVIIRPPLIYGPGVKANFAALMRAVQRGVPLPLGAVKNQRSLLALDNLTDFILASLTHSAAANETFLLSDGTDLSTPELVRQLAHACGKKAYLLPVPPGVLQACATLLGRRDALDRLCGNLQVDSSKARRLLDWTSPIDVAEGLRRAYGVVCKDA